EHYQAGIRTNIKFYQQVFSETPFGLLPVLEVDGKQLSQSNTIARYLARKFGYAGKTPFEEALVDSIADQYNDFFVEILPYFLTILGFRPGDEKTLAKELVLPAREKFFTHMTKWLKNSKSGFLVGDSVTWADLLVAEFAELTTRIPNFYDGFSEVKAHADKIRSIPTLKKWIESRPRTPL
ncbi:unnamed protein product, partial [Nippostrongylus brasiliensis]|uniref:glutathione transferase n=1 Tax=Nippostrongylus brasiliensis TaxID=27835 RepID=A0A0N4XJE0_NIPBR